MGTREARRHSSPGWRPALVLRIPWLAAALGAGALAADCIAGIGHVAGIVGIAASCLVVAGLLIARRRAASARRG